MTQDVLDLIISLLLPIVIREQEALKEIFPNNHQTSCSVHIQRNVLVRYDMPALKFVPHIAKTHSTCQEDVCWFKDLYNQSVLTRKYIDKIFQKHGGIPHGLRIIAFHHAME